MQELELNLTTGQTVVSVCVFLPVRGWL